MSETLLAACCKSALTQIIISVIQRSKDLLAVQDGWFKEDEHLHLSLKNGLLRPLLPRQKDASMGLIELRGHYQTWCQDHHLRPFPSKAFSKIAKEEIETTLGVI